MIRIIAWRDGFLVALDIDRMELLQCTLVTMDSSWMEMSIGHVTRTGNWMGTVPVCVEGIYIRTEYYACMIL